MRFGHPAAAGTGIQSSRRVARRALRGNRGRNAQGCCCGWDRRRGVARDDDGPCSPSPPPGVPSRCRCREQVAAFEHSTRLAQWRAGENDRFAAEQPGQRQCLFAFARRAKDDRLHPEFLGQARHRVGVTAERPAPAGAVSADAQSDQLAGRRYPGQQPRGAPRGRVR